MASNREIRGPLEKFPDFQTFLLQINYLLAKSMRASGAQAFGKKGIRCLENARK
ncbi:MAG: hypothetical protein ACKVOI_04710 [Dongiaceae bacterium]